MEQLAYGDSKILRHFVDSFALKWSSMPIWVGQVFPLDAWHHGSTHIRGIMLIIVSLLQNIVEYFELLP